MTTRTGEPLRQVAAFIRDFHAERRYPPTLEEVRRGCDLSSKSVARRFVMTLAEAGFVEMTPKIARSIRLTESGELFCSDVRMVVPSPVQPPAKNAHTTRPGPASGVMARRLRLVGLLLCSKGGLTTNDLAAALSVSPSLIRSDLASMTTCLPLYEDLGFVGIDAADLQEWMRRLYHWPLDVHAPPHPTAITMAARVKKL